MKINSATLLIPGGKEQIIKATGHHFYLWVKNLGSVAGNLVIEDSPDDDTYTAHAASPISSIPVGGFKKVLVVVDPASPLIKFAPTTQMDLGLAFLADVVEVEFVSRSL